MGRTLLVNMPFAAVGRPSLGLSILKASLSERGLACDVAYLNLEFARALTEDSYARIACESPHASLGGEWVFSPAMFEAPPTKWDAYLRDVVPELPPEHVDALREAQRIASGFVDDVLRSTEWRDYSLVGFTSSGDQNLASLALAWRLKEHHPETVIVFGGPNWHDGAGLALHGQFPFIDAVFTGEADETFPLFVQALEAGDRAAWSDIPGVSLVAQDRASQTCEAPPAQRLDALPFPDYGDYFAALEATGLAPRTDPILQFEASRGCWWAEREPCRFCGLVGASNKYRVKTPDRVSSELRLMAERWPLAGFELADNAVSRSFLDDVLPQLAERPLGVPLFLEARPDLTHEEVRLLARSGVIVQVGIESLSDRTLRLMHKGARALDNIRLLKWCRESGLAVRWNLLYDVPGEVDGDYSDTIALIPAIEFLPPPRACSSLWLERFSTYFREPGDYGYTSVRAAKAFEYVYPFRRQELDAFAYTFEGERDAGESGLARSMWQRTLRRHVREWQQSSPDACLQLRRVDGRTVAEDTRREAVAHGFELDSVDELLCRICSDIASRDRLTAAARKWAEGGPGCRALLLDHDLDGRLARLVAKRLLVTIGDRYLCLAFADPES